jgi:hypothetical protein
MLTYADVCAYIYTYLELNGGHIVNEFTKAGEINDFVSYFSDLLTRETEDRTIQANVFAAGHFRMKTSTKFNQRGDSTLARDCALRWSVNPTDHFQEC